MMRTPFARAYATAAPPLAQVLTSGSRVALYLPAAIPQTSIFARLKQNDRAEVFDKVERALLFEQMSSRMRRLIFRPSQSQRLVGRDEPLTASLRIGKEVREIELQPKFYQGPPSVQDLRVVILTSRTPEDVQDAFNYLAECTRHKATSENVKAELLPLLLRQAAAAGNFQSIYFQLTSERELFEKYLKQEFYDEALRIYALRVPFLSHRSKNMLHRAYKRSSPSPARDLVMVYGLTSYAEKFGAQNTPPLAPYLQNIEKIRESRRQQKFMSLEDIALGVAGMRKAGLSDNDEPLKLMTEILLKRGRYRPLRETLTVDVADHQDESGVAAEENLEAAKATEAAAAAEAENKTTA